jgi:hypothetical protein
MMSRWTSQSSLGGVIKTDSIRVLAGGIRPASVSHAAGSQDTERATLHLSTYNSLNAKIYHVPEVTWKLRGNRFGQTRKDVERENLGQHVWERRCLDNQNLSSKSDDLGLRFST